MDKRHAIFRMLFCLGPRAKPREVVAALTTHGIQVGATFGLLSTETRSTSCHCDKLPHGSARIGTPAVDAAIRTIARLISSAIPSSVFRWQITIGMARALLTTTATTTVAKQRHKATVS